MITRSQAEALLTLAEALEGCASVNIGVCPSFDGGQTLQFIDTSSPLGTISALTGMKVRLAVNDLVPRNGR